MPTDMPGGALKLADDLILSRVGYGAMQLAGPSSAGSPDAPDEATAVLRTAVDLGVTHIDTADFYGAATVNELIRVALHPWPEHVRVATKVGAKLSTDGSIVMAQSPAELVSQVHDNLRHLGLDVLDVVYLRLPREVGADVSIADRFGALAELRQRGLIRHLGLSGVSATQLTEAQRIAPVVAVQNHYNLADRQDDSLVDRCDRDGIAFVPYFPLGGQSARQFTSFRPAALADIAARVNASPYQIALAWLLQRSSTMAVIPGTASVAHLRDNVAAAEIALPAELVAELDAIGAEYRS